MKKSYRIKKESDFQRVFETHNSVANHKFVIYQMQKPNQPHFRVGISVGKKVGNAVQRGWLGSANQLALSVSGHAPGHAVEHIGHGIGNFAVGHFGVGNRAAHGFGPLSGGGAVDAKTAMRAHPPQCA